MGIVESVRQLIVIMLALTCSWYGPGQTNGEPYTASWWYGELPDVAPSRVDYHYLGVATADRTIPFGTKIRVEVVGVPVWARGELKHLIGRSVIVTVVDRMAQRGNKLDLWPAAFLALTGDLDVGIVYVKTEIIGADNGR